MTWPTEAEWADPVHPIHNVLERSESSASPTGVVVRNKGSGSVLITNDLTIGPAGDIELAAGRTLRLEKLRFGKLTLAAGTVGSERCAVREPAFDNDQRPEGRPRAQRPVRIRSPAGAQ